MTRLRKFFAGAGSKYGRLTVIELDRTQICPNGRRQTFWRCACDCGQTAIVKQASLMCGETASCGCIRSEKAGARNLTHGMSRLSEYEIWSSMKKRCLNTACRAYKNYGGRGITVCERWVNSFENFYADMGPRLSLVHTLEREDNDGPYSPENCRWATRHEQMNNTRINVILTVDGETASLAEWCRKVGLNHATILARLAKGWDTKRAVMTPPRTWPSRPRPKGRVY